MNPVFLVLAGALVFAQFALPTRFAFLPLVLAICSFKNVPALEIGGAGITTVKLVLVAGLLRAALHRRLTWSVTHLVDLLLAVWACLLLLTGFAHSSDFHNPLTLRLSIVCDAIGAYLYAKTYIRTDEDLIRFLKTLAFALIPLAAVVMVEKSTLINWYGVLGGTDSEAVIRAGRVRAHGPFAHPILLGTFAATSLTMLFPLRRTAPNLFLIAFVAGLAVVFSSASSGPIMTLACGLTALALWPWRRRIKLLCRGAVLLIVGLHLIMQAPVWYLLARIDLAGGSTGWHRAELITAGLRHIDEWWLAGTDRTRHWMPYGVEWSGNHSDITNHFLQMAVSGGVLLLIAFLAILAASFRRLGSGLREARKAASPNEFRLWCLGSALFAHCVTFISVSYFDQSIAFFHLGFGIVSGVCRSGVRPSGRQLAQRDSKPALAVGAIADATLRIDLMASRSKRC